MANDFIMTNDTSNNRWQLAYSVDAPGTKNKTLKTGGTFVDRDIYVSVTTPTGALSVTGGGLTAGVGHGSLSSDGYYNGSTYDTSDKIDITSQTSLTSGYYKITASGYGAVSRADIKKQITTAGFFTQDSNAVTQIAGTSINSNTGTTEYYIKKSTITATSVAPSTSAQTVTISSGYYPTDRTVSVGAMTTTTRTKGAGSITLTAGNGNVTLSRNTGDSASSSNTSLDLKDSTPSSGVYYTLVATGKGTVSGIGKGSVSTGTGWITAGSTESNEASDSLESNTATVNKYIMKSVHGTAVSGSTPTVPSGALGIEIQPKGYVLIPAGYNPQDRYIYANVADASGESRAASGFSLSISSASGSSDVSVGTLSDGKYPIVANNLSITGTLSAGTSGWFSSGSATDNDTDNITVGKMAAAVIAASATGASAITTVAPGNVTIAGNTQAVTDKTRLALTPTTSTSNINQYYVAIKATAAANSTGTTSSISGTANATVTTAGYAPTTLTGTGSVTGTATAKTSAKDSSVYYIPITSCEGSIGGNASGGSATAAITNVNNINTVSTPSGTAGTDYWQIKATAIGSNGSYTPKYTVTTAGWLPSTVTGSAQTVSVSSDTTGKSLYIPKATFTATDGAVTVATAGYIPANTNVGSFGAATIVSGAGSAIIGDPTYNSSSGKFTLTASGTVAAPSVSTAGYISSDVGTKTGNTVSGSKTLNKISLASEKTSGNLTVAPTLTRTARPSGDTWVDAASGAATTTKPTSGPYVRIDAAAATNSVVIKGKVTSEGYGTTSYYTAADTTYTVGAAAATTRYVPITVSTLPTTVASSATSGYSLKATVNRSTSDQYINIAPGYNTAGGYYKISAVANGSVTAPATITGTDAAITPGTNTITLIKTVSVTPNVTTAGYISSGTAGNSDISLTAEVTTKGAEIYNISTSDRSIAAGTYLTGEQIIKAVQITNLTAANVKYGETVKVGDANDDDRLASVTGTFTGSSTVTSGQTAASSAQILSGYSAWVNGAEVLGGISTMTLPTSAAASATSGYTLKATVGRSTSAQYINIPPGYNSAGAYYTISAIPNGIITNNTTLPSGSSSSGTLNRGKYIKIGAGYYSADKYYLAQGNSGTITISQSGTTSVDGYANANVPSATPAFTGGTISGSVTNITGSNVTLSDTNNGISVTGAASAGRANVTYNGAVNGWVTKTDGDLAYAGTSSNTTLTSKTRYITAITVPKDKAFSVTTTADTALDTTSDVTITNAAYRCVTVGNSGTTIVTSASASAGNLTVAAYDTSSATSTTSKSIVENGVWKTTAATANGTYYGRVTVSSGDYSATVNSHTITKPTITPSIGGNITDITQTSTPSGTNGTDYWTIDPGGSVTTNGSSKTVAKATISTAGYIAAGNKTSSESSITLNSSQITIAAGTNRYLLKASITPTSGTANATANAGTASITTQPSASATATATPTGMNGGYYTDSTTSSYYIDVSASASSNSGVVTATGGSASASVTASSVVVGVGYNPTSQTVSTTASSTGNKTGNTVTTTAATASDSANQRIYFKASTITTSSANDGMSTYFNSGTSSDKNVTITPKYTATAGYRPAVSTAANNGGTTYWKIKTTSRSAGTGSVTLTAGAGSVELYAGAGDSASTGNSSLALATTTPSSGVYYTLTANGSGTVSGTGSGTVSTGTGWVTSGSTTSNESSSSSQTSETATTHGYIMKSVHGTAVSGSTPTVPNGALGIEIQPKGYIIIPAGYNPQDRYIYANAADTSGEARAASGFSLSVSNTSGASGSSNVTVGTLADGEYPIIASNLSITGTLTASTAGWFSSGSATDTDVDSVTVGKMAAAVCTIAGGVLSTSGFTKSDLALTLASGSSTNMSNITIGAQDTSNYPYYFKVNGSTPAVSGTTSASVTAITDTHTAGYLPAKAASNFRNAQSATPAVSVNATSASTYVSLKKAAVSIGGTNSVTGSLTGSNATLTDNNNSGITLTGGGSATITATATTSTVGYAPASTQIGSATKTGSGTKTQYLKEVELIAPSSGTREFGIKVPNGDSTITFVFHVDSSGNVTVDNEYTGTY